jgi:hypothetical protein
LRHEYSQETSTFLCFQAHESSSDFSYLYFKIHVFLAKSRPSKSYLTLRFTNKNFISSPDFPRQHIHIIKDTQKLQNFSLYVINYSYLFNNHKTFVFCLLEYDSVCSCHGFKSFKENWCIFVQCRKISSTVKRGQKFLP